MKKKPTYDELEEKIELLNDKVDNLTQEAEILRESEEKFKTIFEYANDQIVYISEKGIIIDVNEKLEDLFGYKREDVIGKKFTEFDMVGFSDKDRSYNALQSLVSGNPAGMMEFEAYHKDGTRLYIEGNACAIQKDGKIKGILTVIRDITKRKEAEAELEKHRDHLEELVKERTNELINANSRLQQEISDRIKAEKSLRKSEERFRNVLENSFDVIYRLNLEEQAYDYMSPSAKKLFGYSLNELAAIGPEKAMSLIHPEDRGTLEGYFNMFSTYPFEDLKPTIEYRIKHKTRGYRWMSDTRSVVSDENGLPVAIVGNVRDITKRKEAEEKLKRMHEELEIKVRKRTINLEEVNTALKVLLKNREEDKAGLEESMLFNVKEVIVPYLEKMKKSNLENHQKAFIDVITTNLNDIISPFVREMSARYLRLTPTEIQVANLIKQGRTTKEISTLLHLSTTTINTHRDHIRKKIGIKNKKINLRTHLLSFDK